MTSPDSSKGDELTIAVIFSVLNDMGAHACYCPRSVDGGCQCALKDEYLVDAETAIQQLIENAYKKGYADASVYALTNQKQTDDPAILEDGYTGAQEL